MITHINVIKDGTAISKLLLRWVIVPVNSNVILSFYDQQSESCWDLNTCWSFN